MFGSLWGTLWCCHPATCTCVYFKPLCLSVSLMNVGPTTQYSHPDSLTAQRTSLLWETTVCVDDCAVVAVDVGRSCKTLWRDFVVSGALVLHDPVLVQRSCDMCLYKVEVLKIKSVQMNFFGCRTFHWWSEQVLMDFLSIMNCCSSLKEERKLESHYVKIHMWHNLLMTNSRHEIKFKRTNINGCLSSFWFVDVRAETKTRGN